MESTVAPVITIGITAYERPTSLRRAVESVLEQPGIIRGEAEVVIVDDASQSNSFQQYWNELERSVSASPMPLTLFRHEEGSGGASAGRNDIIAAASGKYVLFLDDDNLLAPGALAELVDYLRCSEMEWVSVRRSRGGRSFMRTPATRHEGISRQLALWTFLVCGAFEADMLRRNRILFDAEVHLGEDAEFILQVVTTGERFAALSDRDYFIEADPQPDEAPHISQSTRGDTFASILVDHYARMSQIICRSALSIEESRELQEVVLGRTLGPYRLAARLADSHDESFAEDALAAWSEHVRRAICDADARRWAERTGRKAVVDAVLRADLGSLRSAVAIDELVQ
ncbi:glycosyltransferase family 2 protein [Brevibacterium spongiae]|uniref:Glycosyltransferase n=1 Tax=Brevibacterium spongiae TaxID=2909672 RepID=A0ABY5SQ62_9MICO|nr:glycosyltransferase family 2 protein [Brevibacterium spongiae]UVI36668.1 glycosyltransferase [Brevibacterium spongiae]